MKNSKDGRDFENLKQTEDEARNERMRSEKGKQKLDADQIKREEQSNHERGVSEKSSGA